MGGQGAVKILRAPSSLIPMSRLGWPCLLLSTGVARPLAGSQCPMSPAPRELYSNSAVLSTVQTLLPPPRNSFPSPFTRHDSSHGLAKMSWPLLVVTFSVVIVGWVVGSWLTSPLREFPGPSLASFSRLWHVTQIVRGNQNVVLDELHDKHGETSPHCHPCFIAQLCTRPILLYMC